MVTWLRTFEHDSDMIGGFTPFPSEIIHFQGPFSVTWAALPSSLFNEVLEIEKQIEQKEVLLLQRRFESLGLWRFSRSMLTWEVVTR